MNQIKIALLALALAACGGQIAQEQEEPQQDERIVEVVDGQPVYSDSSYGLQPVDGGTDVGDLGQTSQPLLFAPSGSRQPGFIPGSEESCITGGGPTQNCVVPPMNGGTKGFVYYLTGGQSPRIGGAFGVARFDVYSQLDDMYLDLVAQGAETTGTAALDYRETFDLNDPDLTYVIDVSDSGNFCSGTSSKGLVCITGSTTGISHDSTLVGVYHRMVNVPVIHIDYDDIRNRSGLTTAQKKNVLHQAVVLAFLKGIGQGPKDIAGSTRCDQTTVLSASRCTLPTNAACKLNGWGDFGDPSSVRLLGTNCGI